MPRRSVFLTTYSLDGSSDRQSLQDVDSSRRQSKVPEDLRPVLDPAQEAAFVGLLRDHHRVTRHHDHAVEASRPEVRSGIFADDRAVGANHEDPALVRIPRGAAGAPQIRRNGLAGLLEEGPLVVDIANDTYYDWPAGYIKLIAILQRDVRDCIHSLVIRVEVQNNAAVSPQLAKLFETDALRLQGGPGGNHLIGSPRILRHLRRLTGGLLLRLGNHHVQPFLLLHARRFTGKRGAIKIGCQG